MANVGDEIKRKMKEKEEPPAGAVGDTWFLLNAVSKDIYALLASAWLKKEGITVRLTPDVIGEYNSMHASNPPKMDRENEEVPEGLPLAPKDLETLLKDSELVYVEREFRKEDEAMLQNSVLSPTDKGVIKEAEELARKFGQCYVVTHDTALIRQVNDMRAKYGLQMKPAGPKFIGENLSHLLPELGIKLIVPYELVVKMYNIATSGKKYAAMPYVVVERSQPYTFGEATINVDTAKDIMMAGRGIKIPSTAKYYGIPIVAVRATTPETVRDVYLNVIEQIAKSEQIRVFFMAADKKFFPFVYKLKVGMEVIDGIKQRTLDYEELGWSRIHNKKPYISPGA
jgi:hypothetical protein